MTQDPIIKGAGSPHRHPLVLWSRVKAHSHVFVWLAALAAALALFIYSAGTGGMPGYVEIVEHPIAATEVGRVLSVEVAVGDRVQAGQAIARFDSSLIEADLGVEAALYEEMRGMVPNPEQSALQLQRQFAAALGSASMALDEQRFRQAQDQAELEVLAKELERSESLLAKGLIDASQVSSIRARKAALSKGVALYPQAIANLEQRMEETRRQHQEAWAVLRGARAGLGGGTNFQAEAQRQRVAGMEARRHACVLRSPTAGVVAQVKFRPGDVVAAGTPVAIVVEQSATRIIGFIPEINAREVFPGQRVRVERGFGAGPSYEAEVTAMEPAVRGLPGQVNPVPGRVLRGRGVYCQLKEPTDLLPGETVQVRLIPPFWAPVVDFLGRMVGRP